MDSDHPIRRAKVDRARALLRSGYYVSDDAIRITVDKLKDDLDRCPVGDGNTYRDLVARLIAKNLSNVVDEECIDVESGVVGGRVDAFLPLRLESLPNTGLWSIWQREYRVASILVECKNYAKEVSTPAVDQVLRYIMLGNRGKLAILVSRHGVSNGALQIIAKLAQVNGILILPFSQLELSNWCDRNRTTEQRDAVLRRKRNDIYRMAG